MCDRVGQDILPLIQAKGAATCDALRDAQYHHSRNSECEEPTHPVLARICPQGTVDVPRGCKVHREGNQTVIQISPHCRLTMLYYCIKFPDGCFLGRFFDGCGDAPYGDAQLD